MIIFIMFLRDVARQKLFKSTNASRSYSQNNTNTVFWDMVYVQSSVENKANTIMYWCAFVSWRFL